MEIFDYKIRWKWKFSNDIINVYEKNKTWRVKKINLR